MAERPIVLFSDEIEHVIYNRKAQLRRVIDPQPAAAPPAASPLAAVGDVVLVDEEGPPKLAQRARFEVTAVRAERLQSIDAKGANAEGWRDVPMLQSARERFQEWWNRTSQKMAAPRFEQNPWVWVLELKRRK